MNAAGRSELAELAANCCGRAADRKLVVTREYFYSPPVLFPLRYKYIYKHVYTFSTVSHNMGYLEICKCVQEDQEIKRKSKIEFKSFNNSLIFFLHQTTLSKSFLSSHL